MKDEIHGICREPDFCVRCQRFDELVACIDAKGVLLAWICEECAKEYASDQRHIESCCCCSVGVMADQEQSQ